MSRMGKTHSLDSSDGAAQDPHHQARLPQLLVARWPRQQAQACRRQLVVLACPRLPQP